MALSVVRSLVSAHGRQVVALGLATTGSALAYYHAPFEPATRVLRTASVAASIALDYHLSSCGDDEQCLARVHERSATKILELCLRHGGIFVKAGQYLASLTHVLPPQYTATLATLQDKAHPRPFRDVVAIFELGQHPLDVFEHIDTEPIAAASLAQVHRAVLRKSGEHVAVKIQYPRLHALLDTDIHSLTRLVKIIVRLYPNLDFMWMIDEFQGNMAKEMDFELEGRSAERVAGYLRNRRDVAVPRIHWNLTTKRLLVMEFMEGVRVDNIGAIRKYGFDPPSVSSIVSDVFAHLIFHHGFVHADPHPGNILIRPRPDQPKLPQMVLLDHGLYQELTDEFRLDYCRLWVACIVLDLRAIRDVSRRFGVESYYKLFPMLFTFRPAGGERKPLGTSINKEAVLEEIYKFGQERDSPLSSRQITMEANDFLSSLPRQMLLVLKTQNLVRQINKHLGGTSLGRLKVMFRQAVRGSFVVHDHSVVSRMIWAIVAEIQLVKLRLALWLAELGTWISRFNRSDDRVMIG
ncbi:hypothetical protein PBRA_000761 [Plasmodiophora brassicae]|uniref:ABC1 atypical kinase-like domain-containing protein n=1 Tax=Plasmodiophora brassicae TaxID=37360 RepID=A0A0G4IQK2_PLABS|nr:hypothetical protein PBRA_000761 [Plasmodiophora brassicae]